ncbi:MAG: hypothetical protein JOZ51_12375 [Chloroflexi bacterium]|nr:hypothetical protein [Chloroflexota bacterium]
MPYTKSRARKAFDIEVDELIKVIREAHSRKCNLPNVRSHVLCSAVMLCSAKVEVYLEDVISDWINLINASGIRTDQLPRNFRAYYLNNSSTVSLYKSFFASNDEVDFLKKLSNTLGQDFRQVAIDGVNVPVLQTRYIYADKKYPSPDNMKHLFNRLGISDIFSQLNKSARTDLKAVLVSFNDIRTSVAHQGVPVGLTAKDIGLRLKDVKRVVSHIDKILYFHVVKHTGAICWRTT